MMRCQSRLTFGWKGFEEIIEIDLSINELVDATLGINYAQGFE
jgi:hypothetical protein